MGNPPAVYTYSSMTVAVVTISFMKNDSFKLALKHREGVSPMDLNWELVPVNRALISVRLNFRSSTFLIWG